MCAGPESLLTNLVAVLGQSDGRVEASGSIFRSNESGRSAGPEHEREGVGVDAAAVELES